MATWIESPLYFVHITLFSSTETPHPLATVGGAVVGV